MLKNKHDKMMKSDKVENKKLKPLKAKKDNNFYPRKLEKNVPKQDNK